MRKIPIQQVSTTVSIPSPTGGLNTKSPLSRMADSDAVQMTNAIPTSIGVAVRKGYQLHQLGGTFIESIFSYTGSGATPDKLFVADGNFIRDVTTSGSPVNVVFDLVSAKLKTVQLSNQAGQFLVVANGEQAPKFYNETTWNTFTSAVSPAAPGEFSGTVDLTRLTSPIVHQKRLWFVLKNSSRIVYAPINSLGGALVTFDVGGLFPRGGFVTSICSWTSDGGSGIANRLVIISSEGDCVVFSGADPSVAADFRNDGVWQLQPPAHDRPFVAYDGDILYFANTGIFPLSSYLQSSTNAPPITSNISNTIGTIARKFKSSHGFDAIQVPNEHLLVINIPQITLSGNIQFAFNSETGGWSLFTGLPANCWASLNGEVYFAGGTSVWKAFVGYKDAVGLDGTGGRPYSAIVQQAFSTLGVPGNNKHVSLIRTNLISTTSRTSMKISVKTDFDVSPPNNIPTVSSGTASLWDVSSWDLNNWGSDNVAMSRWQGASGSGTYISIILVIQVIDETVWTSSDLVFEVGGILS